MVNGMSMEAGQSALRPVEEEPKHGPDPAQILLLLTEELNVREKAQRLRNAAHVTVQVNIYDITNLYFISSSLISPSQVPTSSYENWQYPT